MSRSVPAGMPRTLRDLNDAVRKAGNTVFELHLGSTPEQFEEATDELFAAFTIARDLSRPGNVTGCQEHPQGAVDPNPGPGESECLVCNTYRRRGERRRRRLLQPESRTSSEQSPEYVDAAARLGRMPDLGSASITAARRGLGDNAAWEDLVIHAAAHPVRPPAPERKGPERTGPERPGTSAPTCVCGTALDPDGTCLTCQEAS
jgi:hypothetical protein